MGLDMFLESRREGDLGYWRKANAIHNWFIVNCADGDVNCCRMNVSRQQLEELRDTVQQVIDGSKLDPGFVKNGATLVNGEWKDILEDGQRIEDNTLAKRLLPTVSGFFFGSQEYDEYYYEDLVETINILDKALACASDDEFTYTASW